MDGELETLAPAAAGDGDAGSGRAEIDTSAPFESVREAVDRFGGSAAWSSQLIKSMFAPKKHEQFEEVEQAMNVEEQTAQLEKELIIKERETLDVLKELESTKRIITDLKLKLQKETADASSVTMESDKTEVTPLTESEGQCPENLDTNVGMEDPDEHASQPPSAVLVELEQAKANINRTTSDLAAIRASVELLHNSIAKERILVERSWEKLSSNTSLISSLEDELDQNTQKLQTLKDLQRRREDPSDIFIEIKKMTSEIEQLRNMANASKSEVMMLTAEIEQTKASIGTAEVRCLAAKKMEKAARAAEALALAEIKALLSSEEASAVGNQGTDGVTLSVEEYFMLASKAQEADETSRKKIEDAMLQVDGANHSKSNSLKKLEEAKAEVEECKKALEDALKRVDAANRGKLAVEEAVCRWRSEHGHKRRSIHGSPKFKNAAHHRRDSRNMDLVAADVSKSSFKPTLSIGQILSMKLMGPDEYDKSVWENGIETPNVSLGQILNRKHGILCPEDVAARKQFAGKRKKFAFTGLSVLLAKQNKSKKKRHSNSS